MARSSEQALEDRGRVARFTWEEVERLWADIQRGPVAGWSSGAAFEHLVIRGFALSGLTVEYPYDVPLTGRPLERIDGMVYLGQLPFLIECKDRRTLDINAFAKLRNQLSRRPPGTMGCLFVSGDFTRPAVMLSNFAVPHRITLWDRSDVSSAIQARDFSEPLRRKYHDLCMYGLTDQSTQRAGAER